MNYKNFHYKVFFILFLFSQNISHAAYQNKIIANVGEEIITSYELKNKIITFLILNNIEVNQTNVDKSKKDALRFLINQRIKKKEIDKYSLDKNNKALNSHLKNISSKLNVDIAGLKKIFLKNNLSYKLYLDEVEIEVTWQKLVYELYKNKIVVDKKEIEKELKFLTENKKGSDEYELAEIEVNLINKSEKENTTNQIKKSIEEIGFDKTAIKYSISLTSENGGKLGWIPSKSLSKEILNIIKKMSVNEISQPFIKSDTLTFYKLINKKKVNFDEADIAKLKNRIINKQKNELFNLYSKSHISKIKNSILITYNE
jgi:peptidyl-prolyl cis-trans isomerase SurA